MLTLWLVLLALTAALAAFEVRKWLLTRKPSTWLDELEAKAVVVHTRDGKSYAGTLVGVYRDSIVLRHASVLVDNGERIPLEGDIGLPRPVLEAFQYDADVVLAEPFDRVPVRRQ